MKNKIFIFVGVIVVGLGLVLFLKQNKSDTYQSITPIAETPTPTLATPPPITPTVSNKYYTLANVATHNNPSNCWTAINGSVYDLTPWIQNHPGGSEAIISLCGIDGGVAFAKQHEGQSKPEARLASFKIGILK